jgi:hypothetical protein
MSKDNDNVLQKLTEEKNRMITEVITKFLGHEPTQEDRKFFKVINRLGESIIYYQGELICSIKYETVNDTINYDMPEIKFTKKLPK